MKEGKIKKHVDIQKGIFRKVRKFWKTYFENQNEYDSFRKDFRNFQDSLEENERKRVNIYITGFSDCRARLKNIE